MRIDRIVVPTDFSRASNAAVDVAADFARMLDAEMILVHVYDSVRGVVGRSRDCEELYRSLRESAEHELEVQRLRAAAAGARVTIAVREGKPVREILRLTAEQDADLVVMGTNGRHGASRFLLGSVTEGVARRSDAPVVTVRADRTTSKRPPAGRTGDIADLDDIA